MNRENLIAAGIDYDQGVSRFADKAAIYEKYLKKIFDDSTMERLGEQLKNGEYEAAFRSAHDLKGMSGNLSMNQFYKEICLIVEEIRQGPPEHDVMPIYEKAMTLYEQAKAAIME